jgi:hypothetical protein
MKWPRFWFIFPDIPHPLSQTTTQFSSIIKIMEPMDRYVYLLSPWPKTKLSNIKFSPSECKKHPKTQVSPSYTPAARHLACAKYCQKWVLRTLGHVSTHIWFRKSKEIAGKSRIPMAQYVLHPLTPNVELYTCYSLREETKSDPSVAKLRVESAQEMCAWYEEWWINYT